jgi:hypothetical protein
VEPKDRILTAEVCRWVSQQVESQRYRSFQDFVEQDSGSKAVASLPAPVLLTKLQRWLPATKEQSSTWEEFQRIAEFGIMRLGTILPSGGVDLAEFYARFERLAKGGAAAAVRMPAAAGAGMYADAETDPRVSSPFPACPVDFSHVSAQRMGDLANRLQHSGEQENRGHVAFDKLHRILEDFGVQVSRRYQTRLKQWLNPEKPTDNIFYWPPLLALTVSVDRMVITADKHTRTAYPSLQLQVSFCGEVVKFQPFSWSVGMMQPFEPKKMVRTQQCNARFNLDGPYSISPQDLAVAMREPPPPTHTLRISLFGSDCSALNTSQRSDRSKEPPVVDQGSYNYHLGSVDMWMKRDLSRGDIQHGGRGSEKTINWHLLAHGQGPRLSAALTLSTHNAVRVPFICKT